jgi:adenosine kinase
MKRARELSLRSLDPQEVEVVIISPNDPEAMCKYAAECQELQLPFIYDPSQQLARMEGPEILACMQGARALTVNDYELELVKRKTGLTEDAIMDRVGMLVVTRGADGASLMATGCRVDIPATPPRVLRDPTGVGDAFRAGLIIGLVRGYPWPVTGRLGALAATYVLEQAGTMEHHYTVPEFVERYRSAFGDAPELQDLLMRSAS